MKIYSSELLNETEVNQGSLEITDGDHIQIHNLSDVAFNTDNTTGVQTLNGTPSEGLYIVGGTFDTVIGHTNTPNLDSDNVAYHYISGTGAQKNLADVLVAKGSLSGSNLQLFNNADVQIASDIDLSGLGGGSGGTGGGADTNPTNNDLPVKFQNDLAQNVFVNSIVNEIGTFTTPTTVAAMTVNDVTSGMMLTIDNVGVGLSGADQSAAQTAFNTRFGTATPNTTIIVGGTEYTGTLTATLLGAGATFELASGTFSGADEVSDNTAVTLPLVAGARTVTGIQIDGNLEVLGTQTQVDSVTVTLADQFIQLGTPDGSGALAARDSGFLNVVSRSAGDVLNLQGIRYDASTNAWQVSSNTTGVSVDGSGIPDTDSDWATIQTVGGSHGIAKLSATFGASASATAPSVATVSLNGATVASFTNTVVSRVGTDAATNDKYININLGSSDTGGGFSVSDLFGHSVVQVQIFESGSQIIAEEVILGQVRSTTGALSSAANQLTITLPRTAVLGALTVIVIG